MIELIHTVALFILAGTALCGVYRLFFGPSRVDRILSFDMIAISVVAMISELSLMGRTPEFLELILVFSLLGFFGTVMLVFYEHKSHPGPEKETKKEEKPQ